MENPQRWYVVHTHAQAEETAHRHLERQGFATFMPRYLKRWSHARRIDWVKRPMFPRYLFVGIDVTTQRWRTITSTFGVSRLVCQGDRPVPVPDGIVEGIMARCDEGGLVSLEPRIPFRRGDKVQVISGALADHVGLFECTSDDERVFLLLDLLGRQVKVKLPVDTIAAYA